MHGSLLPKYRGRAPVNWAILHGESETGATLHMMDLKPDAGPIVDQMPVAILENDTASDVYSKVVVAAEMIILRSASALDSGTVKPIATLAHKDGALLKECRYASYAHEGEKL